MEAKEDKLYNLIHALTPQEKKYLGGSVSKKTDKKPMYYELFQWLSKMEGPDDNYLKKKLKKLNQEKQLPYLKNYLYHFILDKLFLLESEESYSARVNKLLINAKTLRQKNLLDQSNDLLQKAFKIATEYEDAALLIRINYERLDVLRNKLLGVELLNKGTEMFEEIHNDIKKVENEWAYASINFRFANKFMYVNRARNEEEDIEFKELINNPLLTDSSNALTIKSTRIFHNILSIKSLYDRDSEQFYVHSKSNVDNFQKNDKRIERDIQSYIGSLYTYSKSLIRLKRFKQVDEILVQIEEITKKYPKQTLKPRLQSHIYEITVMIMVNYYLHLNDIRTLSKKLQPFIERFSLMKPHIRVITQLYMVRSFSFVNFCIGSYEKALEWDVFFLNEYAEHSKSRMFLITKLSNLILHYEMNNVDYLPYVVRSTYRFLRKRDSALKFENRMLQLLRSVLSAVEKSDIKDQFTQLRSDLIEIAKDPKENAIHDFVYVQWLEHKITGKPLMECIEEDGIT